jgi:hypothetical protein
MSRKIARLLAEKDHSVTKLINELEQRNGFPSHDARLLADNSQQLRRKIEDLGLDSDDTTAEELYHALLVRFEKNSHLFATQYGAGELSFDARAALAARLAAENLKLPERWALKNAAARKLLHELPPKHLMKHLKYRSVDSMLKREKTAELYLVAAYTEPAIWRKNLSRLVSKLEPTCFELKKIHILTLQSDKWSEFDGPKNRIASSDDVAAVALWPSTDIIDASLLVLALLIVDGLDSPLRHRPAKLLKQASGILEWWADMDYLMAELNGQPLSLNLFDTALNAHWQNEFDSRELQHGRSSFWKELVSRYENLPPAEALFDDAVRQEVAKLKLKTPQPVFELAEDEFDG